jgi:hypothetical protein
MVALDALQCFRARGKMGDWLLSHAGPLIRSLGLFGSAVPTSFNNGAAKFMASDQAQPLSRSGYLSPYTIQCYQVMPESICRRWPKRPPLLGDNKVEASLHHKSRG